MTRKEQQKQQRPQIIRKHQQTRKDEMNLYMNILYRCTLLNLFTTYPQPAGLTLFIRKLHFFPKLLNLRTMKFQKFAQSSSLLSHLDKCWIFWEFAKWPSKFLRNQHRPVTLTVTTLYLSSILRVFSFIHFTYPCSSMTLLLLTVTAWLPYRGFFHSCIFSIFFLMFIYFASLVPYLSEKYSIYKDWVLLWLTACYKSPAVLIHTKLLFVVLDIV